MDYLPLARAAALAYDRLFPEQSAKDSKTLDMIALALSSVMTLSTGDICLTGTPAGVGFTRRPPRYLRPGDVIETEIGGVGALRNRCVAEGEAGAAAGGGKQGAGRL